MLRTSIAVTLIFFAVNLVAVAKDENLIAGKKVEKDAKVEVGTKFVAVYEKKNYLVEVKEIQRNKKLKIVWIETKEETPDISPDELYHIGDATPTRRVKTSPLPESYRKYDKNGDGQISLSEWDRSKYAEFMKLDKNHDGILTPQELAVKGSMPASPAVAVAAKDGDGKIPKDPKETKELPDPGNLNEYREKKVGETFTFTVTGKKDGSVYGTGTYSIDSDLAVAAVHAGVIKVGDTAAVKVTIAKPSENFTGSLANEITSVDREEGGPAFTLK